MTAASLGPGPDLFSTLSLENASSQTRRETFALSLLGQAAVLAVLVYFARVIPVPPNVVRNFSRVEDLPLVFSGRNGGGGGNHDPLPASHGMPPRASLDTQLVSTTMMVPTAMPRLPAEQTVVVAPEVKFPQAAQIGDPSSPFSDWL